MTSILTAAQRTGHVFLSHARADTKSARDVVEHLRRSGIDVWFDDDRLRPGDNWMASIESAILSASAMIVYIGTLGVQKWVDREVRLALQRNTLNPSTFAVIPVLGRGGDLSGIPAFLQQHQIVDLRDPERAPFEIEGLIQVLKSGASRAIIEPGFWTQNSPFRDLRAFESEDSWLFFGRDTQTEELLERLKRAPAVAILGNSGSGKSSLVRAGLIPALHRGRFRYNGCWTTSWKTVTVRPTDQPFDEMAESLPIQLAPELSAAEIADLIGKWKKTLPEDCEALRNLIIALTGAAKKKVGDERILLVVDQFEELFTLTEDRRKRQTYIDALLAAGRLETSSPIHVVFIMRADFYSYCLDYPSLIHVLENNLINVSLMSTSQLRQTIEKRLALAGVHAEPGLIDCLLDDVGTEPGNLVLLEHALGQLWSKQNGRDRTLTNGVYSEIGRLRGALSRHADEVYESFPNDQKSVVRRILLDLVQLSDGAPETRRRVQKKELLRLGPQGLVENLLLRLASNRLIYTSGQSGNLSRESFVEVIHEVLIREWKTLRGWLAEYREDLTRERSLLVHAREWLSSKKDPDALLRGLNLELAEHWLDKHTTYPHPHHHIKTFIEASIGARKEAARRRKLEEEKQTRQRKEEEEKEIKQQKELAEAAQARADAESERRRGAEEARERIEKVSRRLRWLLGSAGALLFVAILFVALFYAERQQARQQELLARSREMAAQAEQESASNRSAALALARRAWLTYPTNEAHSAIVDVFPRHLMSLLGHMSAVTSIAVSRDGRRVVTASQDFTAILWNGVSGEPLVTLKGHTAAVLSGIFSTDGRLIATASADGTARLWNGETGEPLAILDGHAGTIYSANFSPDGKRIVTAGKDRTARIWSLDGPVDNSGDRRHQLFRKKLRRARTASPGSVKHLLASIIMRGHSSSVYYAEFSPDGQRVATAGEDATARVWRSDNGDQLAILRQDGFVWHAEFSPEGAGLLTTSEDGVVRIWRMSDWQQIAALRGHNGPVRHATFSPDGSRIVTAGEDGTGRIWSTTDGSVVAILKGHGAALLDAEFSPDGRYIVTASRDKTANVWNSETGELLARLSNSTGAMLHAQFLPDGREVIAAGEDAITQVWSVVNTEPVSILRGHSDALYDVQWSRDGLRLVTASADGTGRVWDPNGWHEVSTLTTPGAGVLTASFSPDGQQIISVDEGGSAWLWEAKNGRVLVGIHESQNRVLDAAFSPDGKSVLAAGGDGFLGLWDVASRQEFPLIHRNTGDVFEARFSPDGSSFVSVDDGGNARVWSTMNRRLVLTLGGRDLDVYHAEFSPDGRCILTVNGDGSAKLWDSNTGDLIATLADGKNPISHASFSRDGSWIVTAGEDSTARVWQRQGGKPHMQLKGLDGVINDAEFSPDDALVLTTGEDGTVKLWSATSGHILAKLDTHSAVKAVFSPDGRRIAVAGHDSTTQIYEIVNLYDVGSTLKRHSASMH